MQDISIVFVAQCFYLMLPAYFANMAPIMVKKINLFYYPIDFGLKLGSRPILGSHKTFRGLVFGVLFAILVSYLQSLLYQKEFFMNLSFISYENWLLFGFLMGFGALLGDSVKSFLKRRIGIKPGHRFVPFDQIDFVLGSLILSSLVFDLTLQIFFVSLVLSFALDILVNHISFYLKIRDESW